MKRCCLILISILILNSAVISSQIPLQVQVEAQSDYQDQHRLQEPLQSSQDSSSSSTITDQQLHGKFLHITDLHPDPYYKVGSAVESACHWNKPKKNKKAGKQRAGYWGTGPSECDSPPHLITSSLDWISSNWLPDSNSTSSPSSLGIDFIIWTGDSARHDIDNRLPRSSTEIFNLNLWTLNSIKDRFPKIPIIPTLGNNDIFPHNIMFKGPNSITKNLWNIWKDFIPEYQLHTFQYGAYFSNEVISNQLAVVSLNTMFWYNSNKVVDGCRKSRKSEDEEDRDPGTNQLDWLEVQLEQYRSRSMQVHLIGHVPPSSANYFPKCFDRYTDMALRYQDTIVGQHFGHSNIDVFYLQEEKEKKKKKRKHRKGNKTSIEEESDALIEGKESMLQGADLELEDDVGIKKGSSDVVKDLKDSYESIPGRQRTNLDDWSYFFVAPSIVPTSLPSVRVWTYNASRESKVGQMERTQTNLNEIDLEADEDEVEVEEDQDQELETLKESQERIDLPLEATYKDLVSSRSDLEVSKKKKKHNKDKKKKKKKKRPKHTSPNSPSRSNTYLSLLGFSQWTLDINEANKLHDDLVEETRLKFQETGSGNRDEKEWNLQMEDLKKKETLDYRLEYSTYKSEVLWKEFLEKDEEEFQEQQHIPVPRHLLEKELSSIGIDPLELRLNASENEEVEKSSMTSPSSTDSSTNKKSRKLPKELRHFTDYNLPSINVEEILNLARRLVNDDGMWNRYKKRIYSSVE